jgi:hypothetical protein
MTAPPLGQRLRCSEQQSPSSTSQRERLRTWPAAAFGHEVLANMSRSSNAGGPCSKGIVLRLS